MRNHKAIPLSSRGAQTVEFICRSNAARGSAFRSGILDRQMSLKFILLSAGKAKAEFPGRHNELEIGATPCTLQYIEYDSRVIRYFSRAKSRDNRCHGGQGWLFYFTSAVRGRRTTMRSRGRATEIVNLQIVSGANSLRA